MSDRTKQVAVATAVAVVAISVLWLADRDSSQGVEIPGGMYPIGSDGGDVSAQPEHRVWVDPFRMDAFEVTNARYAEFLRTLDIEIEHDRQAGFVRLSDLSGTDRHRVLEGAGRAAPRTYIALDDEHAQIDVRADRGFVPQDGLEDHPVLEVTWLGAKTFCNWSGRRLPTEAEWEAAAGGPEGRRFPWGHELPTQDRAVFGRPSGVTDPVGAHPGGATPEGLHDLAGNVAEWTSSLYWPYPYDATDGREAPSAAGERVTRGGDHVFDSAPHELTTFYRDGFSRAPDRGHRHIGFRCAQ